MSTTDIVARLRLNAEQFSAETRKQFGDFERRSEQAAAKSKAIFGSIGKIGGGIVAGVGIAEIARIGKATLDYADNLSTVADQAGINVERYQTLREATRQLEIDSGSFDEALKRLQQTLGDVQNGVDNGATKALDRMGVSQRILSGEITTADGLLDAIAASSGAYATSAQFAGDAVDIFGRTVGVDMAAALRDGGAALHAAEDQFRQTGRVISEDYVQKLADANEKIDKFYANLQVTTTIWAGNTITAIQQTMNKWQDYLATLGLVEGRRAPQLDAKGKAAVANLQTTKLDLRIAALEKDLAAARFTKPDSVMGSDGRVRALEMQIGQLKAERLKLQKTVWAGIGWGDDPSKGAVDRMLNSPTIPIVTGDAPKKSMQGLRDSAKEAGKELLDVQKIYGDIATQSRDLGARLVADWQRLPNGRDWVAEQDERRAGEERLAQVLRDLDEQRARKQREQVQSLADFYLDAFDGAGGSIWKQFARAGKEAIAVLAAQFTLSMISGQKFDFGSALGSLGATTGNPILSGLGSLGGLLKGGSSIAGLFGGGANALGGTLGGAGAFSGLSSTITAAPSLVGGAAPAAAGGLAGVGGALAAAAPYAAIAAAAIPIVTGLLKHNTSAGAHITGIDTDPTIGGADRKKYDIAGSLAGSVQDGLKRIAEQLGGTATGAFNVTIGTRGGDYRVNSTGTSLKTKNGAVDFEDDQEAAIRYAISDALQDGVIKGISDATKRILQSGQDLDKALEKATLIESIPKLLKQRLDPVGAEIDELNARWAKTVAALREGAASTEQMTEAQKLYKMELDEISAKAKASSQDLRDFADSFRLGSSSPYSLRDQEASARSALQPFLETIAAGGSIDQDRYQAAAGSYLDVQRELYGSAGRYFTELDKIQAATAKAIATIDNAQPIRSATSDPFAEKTATSTQATAEIVAQHTDLLAQQASLSTQLLEQVKTLNGLVRGQGFVGGGRSFVAN